MKFIPMVRTNNFLPFWVFLERLGSPVEKWLESIKLSPFLLEDNESLIPRHLVLSFVRKAAHSEGLENLGLLVGERTSVSALGNFGKILCGSLTLHDALNTLFEIAPANNSGELYWLENNNDEGDIPLQEQEVCLCQRHTGGKETRSAQLSQFAITQLADLVGLAADKEWRPSSMCLQTHQSEVVTGSDFFRGTKVRTGVGFNKIAFPRFLLSLPLKCSSANKSDDRSALENLLSSAPQEDLPGSLTQALVPLLRAGYPDVRMAAEIAGMSVRTLQRRLEEEGLTYSRLVEKARFREAVRWLQEPSVQVIDVALELGYSAHPHFSRAFKRWTGISPAQFRRLARENPDFPARFSESAFLQ